jgi:NADH-quinone oxidoreductase subunit J
VALVTFWILAAMAVGCAIGLLVKRNPIHGALFLVGNLASLAALYLTMHAEFLATAQVIVYAGAIAVLFVFAMMVLIPGKEETGDDPLRPQRWLAVPLGGLLAVEAVLVLRSRQLQGPPRTDVVPGGVDALGKLLFTDYLFPFEVTSLLLLVAIVGVLALARRRTA